jgi:hypothetical protein
MVLRLLLVLIGVISKTPISAHFSISYSNLLPLGIDVQTFTIKTGILCYVKKTKYSA